MKFVMLLVTSFIVMKRHAIVAIDPNGAAAEERMTIGARHDLVSERWCVKRTAGGDGVNMMNHRVSSIRCVRDVAPRNLARRAIARVLSSLTNFAWRRTALIAAAGTA